jgi:Ca2+-binding EF-hand superfamily protein
MGNTKETKKDEKQKKKAKRDPKEILTMKKRRETQLTQFVENTQTETEMIEEFLKKADKDGDTFITFEEFYETFSKVLGSKQQIAFYWRKILHGKSTNEKISREEFIELSSKKQETTLKQEANWWFLSFDSDENGKETFIHTPKEL